MPHDGFPIVLTADETLMAPYNLLLDGMLVASQTTTTPWPVVKALMVPPARPRGVRARVAPFGLRRIEAALIAGGFNADDVAIVGRGRLAEAIGPSTRIVGVATGDPTGLGMHTTTTTAIAGGHGVPPAAFARLMRTVRRLIDTTDTRPVVVAGGPGAWQLARDRDVAAGFGIDHVVTGYAEGNVADIFRTILVGGEVAAVAAGESVDAAHLPPVRGASTMGVVEISRGCGLGCSFCTIANVPMQHVPEQTILADARTNIENGNANICVISEDLFRYGGDGVRTKPEALISLLSRLREIGGAGLIQTDHANIISVEQYADAELAEVHRLMTGDTGQRFPWVNLGIETASGRLLRANGGAGKMSQHADDEWPSVCAEQLQRLCRAGFLPMASIVVGLPGETPDDVEATLRWVDSLAAERVTVFPELCAPIDGTPPVTLKDLTPLHWRLIRACYRLDFKWVPKLYADSQRASGVGLGRRCLIQTLGLGQTALWRGLFAWHSARSRSSHAR